MKYIKNLAINKLYKDVLTKNYTIMIHRVEHNGTYIFKVTSPVDREYKFQAARYYYLSPLGTGVAEAGLNITKFTYETCET